MQITLAIPDQFIDESTINAALEAGTRANEAIGRAGLLPEIGQAISRGVRWRPEPWIGERFDLAPTVASRGWGDCDDLGIWLAAELRLLGEEARAVVRRSGPTSWHVEVERADGSLLDPSKWAGMPPRGQPRALGKPQSPIAVSGESAFCAIPRGGQWHVRADFPVSEGVHISGYAQDTDVALALGKAIATWCYVADGLADGGCRGLLCQIARAVAPIAALAQGQPAEGVADLRELGSALVALSRQLAGGMPASEAMPTPVPAPPGEPGPGTQAAEPAPPPPVPAPAPAPPPPPELERLQVEVPPGFGRDSQVYLLPGPGGSRGRAIVSPGGGPVWVGFCLGGATVETRGRNFERARNAEVLPGLGDPERWGGTANTSVVTNGVLDGVVESTAGQQLVRVQAPDLLARSWNLIGFFDLSGLVDFGGDGDQVVVFLDVSLGVGQSSSTARVNLYKLATEDTAGWVNDRPLGATRITGVGAMPIPLPCVSIAIRGALRVRTGATSGSAHQVTARISAYVAPWSLK